MGAGRCGDGGAGRRRARAAAKFPQRPVPVSVPVSVGSVTDSTARVIGRKLSEHRGGQVLVGKQPGAGCVVVVAAAGIDLVHEPFQDTPEEFGRFTRGEVARITRIVKAPGVKVE